MESPMSTGIPVAPKVRDPKKEASLRLNLMIFAREFKFLAMMTKSKVDDVTAEELNELLFDDARWSRVADAIWGS